MASEFYGTVYVDRNAEIPEIKVNPLADNERGSILAFFGSIHVHLSAEQGKQLHARLSEVFGLPHLSKDKAPAMSPDEEAAHRLLKAIQDSGYHIVEASDGR